MTNKKNDNYSFGKFKRLNYFEGMLLTEQDFKTEQQFFREKMKLHNRMYGHGVVWGLDITKKCVVESGSQVERFSIEPGFALDCAGNEIIVCHPYKIPLDEKINALLHECKPINEKTRFFITINYREYESNPEPQYASACDEDELQVKMSRICEGYAIQVLEEKAVPDCCKYHQEPNCDQNFQQDCPGLGECCEDKHVLVLGCIGVTKNASPNPGLVSEGNQQSPLAPNFKFYIDSCCKPLKVCVPGMSAEAQWECQKQQVIHQICETSGYVDLPKICGLPLDKAAEILRSKEIQVLGPKPITEIYCVDKQLLGQIKSANSYAVKNDCVLLISDENKQCVLFAIVENIQGPSDECPAEECCFISKLIKKIFG